MSGAAEPSVDRLSRFLRFFNLGDAWWADRCLQPWHRIGPHAQKRLSLVQVDLPFECSSSSRLCPRAKSIVSNLDHRKRSSGPRKPTGSVLDRRNFRNPGVYLVV